MKRAEIVKAFVRVCRDSGWKIDAARAARLSAAVLGITPLMVWSAIGIANAHKIAAGTHKVCKAVK